jgi:PhnB protein
MMPKKSKPIGPKHTQGATIVQDLAPAAWSALYGMLKDRFGVTWSLEVAVAYSA